LQQQVGIDPRLQPLGQPTPRRAVAGGLPVEDHRPPFGGQQHQIVFGHQPSLPAGPQRRRQRHLGEVLARQRGRRGRQIGLPPSGQIRIPLRHGRQPRGRHPYQLLLHQEMKKRALLDVALVLQNRLSLHRRPGDALQIAQLEAPRAVHEILQAALAEVKIGGEGHGCPLGGDAHPVTRNS